MNVFIDITPKRSIARFSRTSKNNITRLGRIAPFFPTKQVTRRKQEGNFKLDTTLSINEENIKKDISSKSQRTLILRVLAHLSTTKFTDKEKAQKKAMPSASLLRVAKVSAPSFACEDEAQMNPLLTPPRHKKLILFYTGPHN